jgi:hypothetical protein
MASKENKHKYVDEKEEEEAEESGDVEEATGERRR